MSMVATTAITAIAPVILGRFEIYLNLDEFGGSSLPLSPIGVSALLSQIVWTLPRAEMVNRQTGICYFSRTRENKRTGREQGSTALFGAEFRTGIP